MALGAGTIWEVEVLGSDTLNGGAFDPGQTAGMFTDGAATVANTSAPVFTSASYNFVAGDVGAWLYLSSGSTGATVAGGWYPIASVAANAATLNGTIGQGVLKTSLVPTTVVGCANGASPTAITWTIDYSQQAAAQFAYTDLASAGTGLTVSSAAKPFAKQQVGNSLVITGGTNFNTGRYVIASVAASVATVVGSTNITTGAGATGTGGLGGAFLSPALPAGLKIANNTIFIKTGTYLITSASTNVAGGCLSDATNGACRTWEGYGSVRGDLGTPPILQASGISSATLFTIANSGTNGSLIRNLVVDGNSLSTITGVNGLHRATLYKVTVKNCPTVGITGNATTAYAFCLVTGCGGGWSTTGATYFFCCEANANTGIGFNASFGQYNYCLSTNNTGASSDGFSVGVETVISHCVAYGNGRDGFRIAGLESGALFNLIAESNTGFGFGGAGAAKPGFMLVNCAGFSNTGGNIDTTNLGVSQGFVTGSASFFTNAAGGNFALNTTAGGGALARAAGLPGVYPRGLTTGFVDLGAAQHVDPVKLLVHGGLDGGMRG